MTSYPAIDYERRFVIYGLTEELRKMSPENEVVLDEKSGIVTIISKDHPMFNLLREMRQERCPEK